MVNYASLATTAQRLINENGRTVTLTKTDRTPADSNKPWRAGGSSDTTVDVVAVLVPYESKDVDGTLVKRGDNRAYVAALDTGAELIEDYDTLVDSSDYWRIQAVEVINPGDTRVLYDIQLRR
jgi:hypothetical protein